MLTVAGRLNVVTPSLKVALVARSTRWFVAAGRVALSVQASVIAGGTVGDPGAAVAVSPVG